MSAHRIAGRAVGRQLMVVVGVLLAGALTACGAAMPDSGVAGAGRPVGDSLREPLQIAPQGPRPEAGPTEIVGGFLSAGAGSDEDHAVARTFLDGDALERWRPNQGTVVYDDKSLTVTAHGSGTTRRVVVSAPVYATIDASGRFVAAAPGTTDSTTFQVRRLGQVWRVETLATDFGLWMSRYEFERAYTPLRVAFVAIGTHHLVSDLRWFTGPRASLATQAVRAVLNGPPDYLRGAVATGFPPGTTLGVDAVPTSGGTAAVDLSTRALAATPDQREQLFAQLLETLRQLPNVTDVSVTAGGGAFPIPGVEPGGSDADLGFRAEVPVSGPVLVLSDGRLMSADPAAGTISPDVTGRFAGRLDVSSLRSIAAGPQDDALVGVDVSGRRLLSVSAQADPEPLTSGGDLVPPVIDPSGWAWTADRAGTGGVVVTPATRSNAVAPATDESVVPLRPDWLAHQRVIAVDVSRDGSRLAVVSRAPDGSTRLDVAGIVRNEEGAPTSLAQPFQVGRPLRSVADVSWADRTTLVVLGGNPGQRQPYQVEVGGRVVALPKLKGAVGVWAGSGVQSVYAVTSAGQVAVRSGNGWRTLGPGTAITIPT
ncbi:LpqB family beta-propeller domain-containing protein [Angustibacter luteus]|uniref:LpqB family beta-propeller domain-containing protein n=1 Tax=Angustibacter luteus TaxID=658456 RepID=A0ABW1JG01_9ACTN